MTRFIHAVVLVLALAGGAATAAFAERSPAESSPGEQEETPSATPAPSSELTLRFDDQRTFTWNTIEGAVTYTIQGNVFVVRANAADPFCSPPLVAEDRNVNITGSFGESATSYTVELPELPPEDQWLVASFSVSLFAYGAEQTQPLAQTVLGAVAETACRAPDVPTPLPATITVGQCEIPAGFIEVTTPAAEERGQRVFDSGDGATRIYVRADGSCVTLQGAIPPVPEFAPEGDLGARDVASDGIPAALPETGDGPATDGAAFVGIISAVAATAIACFGTALLLKYPRER